MLRLRAIFVSVEKILHWFSLCEHSQQPLTIMTAASERDRAIAGHLVQGYLAHARLLNGHSSVGDVDRKKLDPMSSDLLRALLSLVSDYEARYRDKLAELSASWQINAAAPRVIFVEVLDTIFADGCHWGRIVTIFIFVGMFVRKCRDQRVQVTPLDVADWTVAYLTDKIVPWIHDNGGWMSLVDFHDKGDVAAQMQEEGQLFKRLLTVAGAAGLALLGITSLLANRA